MVQLAMKPNATDKERVFGAKTVSALQKKLGANFQGHDCIRDQQREWVETTLEQYATSAKEKDIDDLGLKAIDGEESENSAAASLTQMRKINNKAARELLRVVRLSMPPAVARDGAGEAASELRKVLEYTYVDSISSAVN